MGAKGDLKLERQRQAPEGACLAPKAADGSPLLPFTPSLSCIPPQPACANRIQKVIQSPGSEFLEDPGWGLPVAGRRPGGREGSDKDQVPTALPFHGQGGGRWEGVVAGVAVCLPKPGFSRGLQIFFNWLPGEKVFSPESLRNGSLIRPRCRVNLAASPCPRCFYPHLGGDSSGLISEGLSYGEEPGGQSPSTLSTRLPLGLMLRDILSVTQPGCQDLDKALIAFCFPQGQ